MTEESSENIITDETKLQIAQFFLLSSPPGEFVDVLGDVKKLLPESLLSDSLAAGIARAYNLKNGKVITTPYGNNVTMCPAAEIEPTLYVDPNNSKLFQIDHLSMKTSNATGTGNTESYFENERLSIQIALNNYIVKKYQAPQSGSGAYIKENIITIIVTGEKPNLRNFWSGRFTSSWSVVLSSGTASMSGEIKIHAHYFEDGNVQLQSTKVIGPKSFSYDSADTLASQVIDRIDESETALQSALDEMYATMNEETFKAMRRVMPITKSKMEWNINAVRMVQQIRK